MSGTQLAVFFTCTTRERTHNNGCDPLPKQTVHPCSRFVYVSCPIRNSTGIPGILTEYIHGFPQSVVRSVKSITA
jgi:hypothetical protein